MPISNDLINILKYGYENDPQNKTQYSQAADYLRGINPSEATALLGSDMPMPTGFDPQTLNYTELMKSIEPYKSSSSYSTLVDAINKFTTPKEEVEPAVDPFDTLSPYLTEEQMKTVGEAASGQAGAGIDKQITALEAMLSAYEDIDAESLTPDQLLKMAQEMGVLQFDSIIVGLENSFNTMKATLENQKGEVDAAYVGAFEAIQNGIRAARGRTKADLNARGLFFSGVLTKALTNIELKGLEIIGKTAAEKAARLAAISNNLAVLTANFENSKLQQEAAKSTYVALNYQKMLTADKKEQRQLDLIMAELKGQIEGLKITKDTIMDAMGKQAVGIAQDKQMEVYIAIASVLTDRYKAESTRIHNYNTDQLAYLKFDQLIEKDSFYARLALDEFALDILKNEQQYGLDRDELELKWSQLSWQQKKYYLELAKDKELKGLENAGGAALGNLPQDMDVDELQDVVTNLYDLSTWQTIPGLEETGRTARLFFDETFVFDKRNNIVWTENEKGEKVPAINSPQNGIRWQIDEMQQELNVRMKIKGDLIEIQTMDPYEYHEWLSTSASVKTDQEGIIYPEQRMAFLIAEKGGFLFDDENSLSLMFSEFVRVMNETERDIGIDWLVVQTMLFGRQGWEGRMIGQP